MDPYRTLGVTRGCTREDVKEAFRARVASAHPDRGGEEAAFIELRTAYERILAELDRRTRPRRETKRSARPSRNEGGTKPLDSTPDPGRADRAEVSRHDHTPRPPDPVISRRAYISWLSRASAEADRRDPRRRRKWARVLGATFLLSLVLLLPIAGLVSVAIQILDLEKALRRAGWDAESLNTLWVVLVLVVSLLAASCIMWKHDPL
jgi:DnaJ domain